MLRFCYGSGPSCKYRNASCRGDGCCRGRSSASWPWWRRSTPVTPRPGGGTRRSQAGRRDFQYAQRDGSSIGPGVPRHLHEGALHAGRTLQIRRAGSGFRPQRSLYRPDPSHGVFVHPPGRPGIRDRPDLRPDRLRSGGRGVRARLRRELPRFHGAGPEPCGLPADERSARHPGEPILARLEDAGGAPRIPLRAGRVAAAQRPLHRLLPVPADAPDRRLGERPADADRLRGRQAFGPIRLFLPDPQDRQRRGDRQPAGHGVPPRRPRLGAQGPRHRHRLRPAARLRRRRLFLRRCQPGRHPIHAHHRHPGRGAVEDRRRLGDPLRRRLCAPGRMGGQPEPRLRELLAGRGGGRSTAGTTSSSVRRAWGGRARPT